MSVITTRTSSLLAPTFVLAPERYDPRRELDAEMGDTVPLGQMACIVRNIVNASDNPGACLVFDTSDAREGVIVCRKQPTADIGSAKKIVEAKDVIVSRLRPYLRQVAYVDDAIPNSPQTKIVCSTEFFVLRSLDERSIAFLVPFFLCRQVQEVFAVSQEGGHHPRFNEHTLTALRIPNQLVLSRDATSDAVIESIQSYRACEATIDRLVACAESSLPG